MDFLADQLFHSDCQTVDIVFVWVSHRERSIVASAPVGEQARRAVKFGAKKAWGAVAVLAAESKVGKFELKPISEEDDIVWLDIAMYDLLLL